MVVKRDILCQSCRDKNALMLGEKRQADKDKRLQAKLLEMKERLKPAKVEICDKSPTQRHWWILDSLNIGVCKYCEKRRDFRKRLVKFAQRINMNDDRYQAT